MGRHSLAESLGLVTTIIDLYENKHMTHEEIAKYLEEQEGVKLSREAVRRAYNKADAKAEKYKIAAETARSIIEASKGTNTELAEAANSMVTSMFYERILKTDALEFEDDAAFFKAFTPIMKNQAILAQARLNYENGKEKAINDVWDELSEMLADSPELLKELKAMLEKIKDKE